MKRFHVSVMAIVIAAGFATSPVWGQSATWTTNTAGDWSIPGNWMSLLRFPNRELWYC
jgi:hypothetical protein